MKPDSKGSAFDDVYHGDEGIEEEEEDNEGDMLVVPAPQHVQPTTSERTSPRHARQTMNINSMIQQELVDDCSDEEVKWRRRDRREKREQKKVCTAHSH